MAFKRKRPRSENCDAMCERYDELYIIHKDPLYRIALEAINDTELALDVVNRTFIYAFRQIDDLEDAKSDKTKAFMVATLKSALNLILQQARDKAGIPGEFEKIHITETDKFNVDQVLIRNEMLTNLARYVERLTYRERELLFYHFFMGWAASKLKEYYKLPEEDIENRIFQIKQKIAKMMLSERRP